MNISPQPHGASQQSQRLCPSTATSSCTEKALLPAAGISSPPRWPFPPFLSREAGTSVPPVPGHHGPAGLRGAGTGHLAPLPFGAAGAPSGAAARGHGQRRAGPGHGFPSLATVCSSCLLGRFPVRTYSVCRPVAF